MKIIVTTEDVKQNITVDEYLDLVDSKPRAIVDVLSRFLSDDEGVLIPQAEARKKIGALPLGELNDLAEQLVRSLDGGAANFPKGSG